jgi:hypothetical protein
MRRRPRQHHAEAAEHQHRPRQPYEPLRRVTLRDEHHRGEQRGRASSTDHELPRHEHRDRRGERRDGCPEHDGHERHGDGAPGPVTVERDTDRELQGAERQMDAPAMRPSS